MTLEELNNLDPNDIGSWPIPVRLAILIAIAAAILYAGWHFDVQPQRDVLATEEKKEVELKGSFERKQKKAANLEALKKQMAEMQQSFGDMLRQLPNKTEVAGLIVDISQTGLAAGLEFKLFKPGKEIPSEFYAELPIDIDVTGNYHQMGEFISGVASLPRIVTTHDILITPEKGKRGAGIDVSAPTLSMKAKAKTYRALDDGEGEG